MGGKKGWWGGGDKSVLRDYCNLVPKMRINAWREKLKTVSLLVIILPLVV
jgi:hypothetical protein